MWTSDLEYKLDGLFLTKGSTTLVERYHAFGDHLNLQELNNDSVDTTRSQYLGYDDAQRLTSASASGTYGSLGWTYDKVGNRLTEARTPAGSSTSTTSTFTYPATSNLLASVTQGSTVTRAFTYDAAGNTVQDRRGSTAYTYGIDDAGRIAQLTIGTTPTASYGYDAKSRLSMRQTQNMSASGTTYSLYDIWDHLLEEYDGSGTIQKLYIWVGDEPVAVVDWTVTGSALLLYVHTDHLHRPEMMTDGSGNVVWRASYEPFGAVSSISGSVTENRRFPGQYFQLEAGLAYNWHRHYDPTIGRYTSPDPLGVRAGPSVHGYVAQNPLLSIDRTGLMSIYDIFNYMTAPPGPYCPVPPNLSAPAQSNSDGSPEGPPASSGPPPPPTQGAPNDPASQDTIDTVPRGSYNQPDGSRTDIGQEVHGDGQNHTHDVINNTNPKTGQTYINGVERKGREVSNQDVNNIMSGAATKRPSLGR